jgi:AcrR family transcriptional regulator
MSVHSFIMARPKSEDKRNAILSGATHVFAERGLAAAPTSEISKRAGVAEGTLFTYFKTKDDLINSLYREIKLEMADAMMAGFPRKKGIRAKLEHVWNRYVIWGVANPEQRKVMSQLQVSDMLTEESRDAGMAPFAEIKTMTREAIEQRILRDDVPLDLISKALGSLAEATMDLITANPASADKYQAGGFQMYWSAVTGK